MKKAINNMSYIFEKVYKHTQKQLDGHTSKCELWGGEILGDVFFSPLTSSILSIFSAIPSPPYLTNISAFIVLDKALRTSVLSQSYPNPHNNSRGRYFTDEINEAKKD